MWVGGTGDGVWVGVCVGRGHRGWGVGRGVWVGGTAGRVWVGGAEDRVRVVLDQNWSGLE